MLTCCMCPNIAVWTQADKQGKKSDTILVSSCAVCTGLSLRIFRLTPVTAFVYEMTEKTSVLSIGSQAEGVDGQTAFDTSMFSGVQAKPVW